MTREEIKEQYSMKDILARYSFYPNRAGFIKCPFHRGDRDASLKVYQKDYHCFGCGANGDIFSFVMAMDGLTFRQAFKSLGGTYEKANKADELKLYRAKMARKKARDELLEQEAERRRNDLCISVYRRYMDRLEPLTGIWCDCYNALQKELYIHDILNGG